MKLTDLFQQKKSTFSFELFPPRSYKATIEFGINVGQLLKMNPDYISVTYGAGGSTQKETFDLIDYLQNSVGLNTMAHYTCLNATREKVEQDMNQLKDIGIENLMLLRGDPPKGQKNFVPTSEDFKNASDLVAHVNRKHKHFGIGVAGYPEKHPEAEHLAQDLYHLKYKMDQGADFIVTQMFFDNAHYYRFAERCKEIGITQRIIPGIIPITNFKQIKRFSELAGSQIPEQVLELFKPHENNPKKLYEVGVYYALKQCIDLLENGAPGIHFYTLNKSRATIDVFESIPSMLKR
ncbi:MAG: methylenetetrahydrofolate reductase [NAD(P)H] [Cytophagales bacterium]|nr:methylenetetrahydrofolate reductase [NAD(P)H] [Cytophagales bacterium]